jgi:Protein of unknown function (DUF1800)
MTSVNWTRDAAAHLLRRAGFGGTPSEIDALYARGLEGAVSSLVDYDSIDLTSYEASLAAKNYNLLNVRGIQQWFLDRMAFSPRAFQEKMTYFWNLRWTSGIAKVRGETLILNQNKTERQYGSTPSASSTTSSSGSPRTRPCSTGWTTGFPAARTPTRTTRVS